MNKKQESVKNMYMVLRSFVNAALPAIIASMPQIDAGYTQWNDLVDTLTTHRSTKKG